MLIKTEKGREELRPGHRSLGQRERAILLLVDGTHAEAAIAALFLGGGRSLIDQLLSSGHLTRTEDKHLDRLATETRSKCPPWRAPMAIRSSALAHWPRPACSSSI